MYSVRVSPPICFHPDLKNTGGEVAILLSMLLQSRQLDQHSKECFFFPDLVQPHLTQGLVPPFPCGGLQAPAAFIGDLLLFGSGDASCLSHLRNALTSTKLQSQVPECLAKPCPLLPWWDVLTATPPPSLRVSVALPRCRSGMRLISSSLHELRHPFFRVL